MVRKCKYFLYQTWWYPINSEIKEGTVARYGCKISNMKILDECKGCTEYTPAELNPDWKDIIEEFNRRLSNDR